MPGRISMTLVCTGERQACREVGRLQGVPTGSSIHWRCHGYKYTIRVSTDTNKRIRKCGTPNVQKRLHSTPSTIELQNTLIVSIESWMTSYWRLYNVIQASLWRHMSMQLMFFRHCMEPEFGLWKGEVARVCQMLIQWMKNSFHLISIWDTVTKVLLLCSIYQASYYESDLTLLALVLSAFAYWSVPFILEVVCTAGTADHLKNKKHDQLSKL